MINVEVIFAVSADQLWHKKIQVSLGTTLEEALQQSGFYQEQAECWHQASCGVFGVQRARNYLLADRDQIEIYRPLRFDPMESRRRRAAHKLKAQKQKASRRRRPSAAARMILNQ